MSHPPAERKKSNKKTTTEKTSVEVLKWFRREEEDLASVSDWELW